MKKLFTVLLLAFATVPALAQHHGPWNHHRHYGPRYYPNYGWVAPMVIGGVVTYALTRPPVVEQPTVVVQSVPVPTQQNCTPWTETQHADGSITRTRTCTQ